jgi:FkbM family methyltransferase
MINRIIKRIYLLRKAYLTDFLKVHYSQFGEDIILKELLREDVKKGFYVDVGCYHPKKFSNTYFLYRRGWNGINIDIEEDKINLFNIVRPRDINVLKAVSDKKERVTRYQFSKYGLDSTIVPQNASGESRQIIMDAADVYSETLNEIIENSPFKGRQIDVLSIDVEGMDYKVLNSLNIEVYKPKLIIIEDHHKSIDAVLNTDIYNLMKHKGYVLRSWAFYSLIFILPGSDILKEREIE